MSERDDAPEPIDRLRKTPPPVADDLGAAGEESWQRLRQHLEWAKEKWFSFMFASSGRQTAELRARTTALLAVRGQRLRTLRPESPAELAGLLPSLLDDESGGASLLWVESLSMDAESQEPGPWTLAWDQLLLRANERRELLRRHLGGGLLFVASPARKARFREAAPDLWSIRGFVISVGLPSPRRAELDETTEGPELEDRQQEGRATPDVELALMEAARLDKQGPSAQSSRTRELVRAGRGLLNKGRLGEAMAQARQALDLTTPDQLEHALALGLLAEAEARDGDDAAAARHLDAALAGAGSDASLRLRWLSLKVRLARERGDLSSAERAAREAVDTARAEGTPRDLSKALDNLGRVLTDQHNFASAEQTLRESLAISRRIRNTAGDTPEVLRDISIRLITLVDILRFQQNLTGAEQLVRESLETRRRIRAASGDTPQALRSLSAGLGALGSVLRDQGNLPEAERSFREAVQILRDARLATGDTPQTLLALSTSLKRLGRVLQDQKNLAEAELAFRDSLEIGQSVHGAMGDTPRALRDLAIGISELSGILHVQGKLSAAEQALHESVAIFRRIHAATGDTPTALHDLSITLDRLGMVFRDRQNLSDAEQAFRESVEMLRRIRSTTGDNPQTLKDLAAALIRLGKILDDTSNVEESKQVAAEVRKLYRRLSQGPSSEGERRQAAPKDRGRRGRRRNK